MIAVGGGSSYSTNKRTNTEPIEKQLRVWEYHDRLAFVSDEQWCSLFFFFLDGPQMPFAANDESSGH